MIPILQNHDSSKAIGMIDENGNVLIDANYRVTRKMIFNSFGQCCVEIIELQLDRPITEGMSETDILDCYRITKFRIRNWSIDSLEGK